MEESGRAGRGLLVLVRNRTAADQTDLCVELRKMFLLTTSSENVFLSRLHQSFAKAAIVKHGISLSLRTEPRTVRYIVVKCPTRIASRF